MKIFICTLLPFEPSRFGGGYQAMYSLIANADKEDSFTTFYYLFDPEEKTKLNLNYIKLTSKDRLIGWIEAQINLYKYIKLEKPELIICSPDRCRVGAAVIVGKLLGVKSCIWQMDDTMMVPDSIGIKLKIKKIIRKILTGIFFKCADIRIAASESLASLFLKRYNAKTDLIISKPLEESFEPVLKTKKNNEPIRLVYAGSSDLHNYLEPVLKISESIKKNNYEKKFEIYLYGPTAFSNVFLKYDFVKLMGSMDSQNTIEPLTQYDYGLLTYSNHSDVIDFFRKSFPSKLIGYLGAGIPVISILNPKIEVTNLLKKWDIGIIQPDYSAESLSTMLNVLLNTKNEQWMVWAKNSYAWANLEFKINVLNFIKSKLILKI